MELLETALQQTEGVSLVPPKQRRPNQCFSLKIYEYCASSQSSTTKVPLYFIDLVIILK